MDQQLLRDRAARAARRRTTVDDLTQARPEVMVIEQAPAPLEQRVPNTIYQNLADFMRAPNSPIDQTGTILNETESTDRMLIAKKIVRALEKYKPDICIKNPKAGVMNLGFDEFSTQLSPGPCEDVRYSMVFRGRATLDLWAIVDFKRYTRLIPQAPDAETVAVESLLNILSVITTVEIAGKFLQAYNKYVWSVSPFILSYLPLESPEQIFCKTLENGLHKHQIIFDATSQSTKITIINKIDGINLVSNGRCLICNKAVKTNGCCLKGMEIEEEICLDLERNCVVVRNIVITNFPNAFIAYVRRYFAAEQNISLHQLAAGTQAIFISKDSRECVGMRSLSSVAQHIAFSNFWFNHLLSPAGKIRPPPLADQNQKLYLVYQDFSQIKPKFGFLIRANDLVAMDFAEFDAQYAGGVFSKGYKLAEEQASKVIYDALNCVATSRFAFAFREQFIYAYHSSVWYVLLDMLNALSVSEIKFQRFYPHQVPGENHEIIINPIEQKLEIHNKYIGIKAVDNSGQCANCKKIVGCECFKNVTIEEILYLDLAQKRFFVKEIKITNFPPEFFQYVSANLR